MAERGDDPMERLSRALDRWAERVLARTDTDDILAMLDVLARVDPDALEPGVRGNTAAGLGRAVALVDGLVERDSAALAASRALRDRTVELLERFGEPGS